MSPVLSPQRESLAPQLDGYAHRLVGHGSKLRDTQEGRDRISEALACYAEHCRYTGTPFACPRGSSTIEVEVVPEFEASGLDMYTSRS